MDTLFDTRQLNAFVTLVRTGSYTRTAKELFLTQSAISHSIKALERDVGCALIRKVGKKIQLTEPGETLYHAAEEVLVKMDRAREAIANLGEWGGGRLRIGAGSTPCRFILPTVLREFRECFPRCQIRLLAGDTPAAMGMLADNEIDLAFCLQPPSGEGTRFIPMLKDEMKFVVSPTHPLAGRSRINVSELRDEQFILYQRKSYTYRMIARVMREAGLDSKSAIELGSIEAIKELLKISLGIGVMAPWVAAHEIEEGSLATIPMGKMKIQRTWGIAHARERKLSLIEDTFVGLCEATCRSLSVKFEGLSLH